MPYHLSCFVEPFKNELKNTIHVFGVINMVFKTAFKPWTFWKMFNVDYDRHVHKFPMIYYKPHLNNFAKVQTMHIMQFNYCFDGGGEGHLPCLSNHTDGLVPNGNCPTL